MFYSFGIDEVSGAGHQENDTVSAQPAFGVVGSDGVSREAWRTETAERLTIGEAFDAYLEAKKRSPHTRAEYETTRRAWANWCLSPRSLRPRAVNEVTADDLEAFLGWVYEQAVESGNKNPGCTHNKYLKNMQAVWRWLARRRKISAIPLFPERREQRTIAGDHFLTDEEMGRIYEATYQVMNPRGWDNPFSLQKAWRAALVCFRNYGFDTHALWHKKGCEQLCWRHISLDPLPPGRVARVENEHGWIGWRRQKTGVFLILPLEPIVAAHLESLRPENWKPEGPVFGVSSVGKPNDVFRRLCRWAKVPDKLDIESGDVANWVMKDLRKTCATMHGPDVGRLMLGHSGGTITEKHYANSVPILLEAIRKLPQPKAFRAIIDESILAPGLLFAK